LLKNGITSHTILNERLNKAMGCYPDYVLVWIGTNDVRAMYKTAWGNQVVSTNGLPHRPSISILERNLVGIVSFIRQSSPAVKIAICTLPPMGEDLKSSANKLVRDANQVIERVGKSTEACAVIPVFDRLESLIEKSRRGKKAVSVEKFFLLFSWMMPAYHIFRVGSWNTLSAMVGNTVMTDGIHLNERGAAVVTDLIVEWLLKANVAKAIAVKG
jgi:acyl-CoA thioesterase-1